MRSRRQRQRQDRGRRVLSTLLIIAGLALILMPFAHTAYAWAQQQLMARGIFLFGAADEPALVGDPPPVDPPPSGGTGEPTTPPADPPPAPDPTPRAPVWRIYIPKLKVDAILVYGTTPAKLAQGPGVYPEGVKPGEPGNLVIAGHRNAYGNWFRHLDKLVEGDVIYVTVNNTAYFYEVERVFVIKPTDWSVIKPVGYDVVTLTTCHPYGSTTERLVVRGRLVQVVEGWERPGTR